jgi:hypothetical protein
MARFLTSLVVATLCGTLSAEEIPLKYEPNRKKDRFEVLQLLRDGAPIPLRQQETFADYFNFYILPPFAMPQKQDVLPQERSKIRTYFATAKIGVPYDELSKLVMNYMREVILKNPRIKSQVARYNAVLVIGDLNAFEGNSTGGKYAKPLPEALPVLVDLLKDEKQPAYIHVAAIVGIQRHAAMNSVYPIEQAAKGAIAQLMLKLLQQSDPPATSSASGHAYLRATAAEILAQINDPGINDALLAAIQQALDEPDAPRSMKMALCGSIGMVEIPKPTKVDLAQLAGSVGRASIVACEQELERSRELELERQQAVDPDRRRIGYFLHQAELAFDGLPGKHGGLTTGAEGTPNGSLIAGFGKEFAKLVKEIENLGNAGFIDRDEMQAKLADLKAALPKQAKAARVPSDVAQKERAAAASK